MIEITRFINSRFSSNTYVVSNTESEDIWIIDPGDIVPVREWMVINSKSSIVGVLITHAHFDHIYGGNVLLTMFPSTPFYVNNQKGNEILRNAKKNGSKYTEEPFELDGNAKVTISTGTVTLWKGVYADCFSTPGHSEDSMCIMIDRFLFTGDTLIKDIRTVTKLKGGSADALSHSINRIKFHVGMGLLVYPGHGDSFQLDNYDLNKAIIKIKNE